MTDPYTAMFVDKSLIGGMSAILNPFAFANNPQMGELNNPNRPFNTKVYMDANNIYCWAKFLYLPTCGFDWVDI